MRTVRASHNQARTPSGPSGKDEDQSKNFHDTFRTFIKDEDGKYQLQHFKDTFRAFSKDEVGKDKSQYFQDSQGPSVE